MNRFQKRRNLLLNRVPNNKIILLGNDPSPINYSDNTYPFRQDSTFLYFTGLNLPGLALILDGHTGMTTLIADAIGPDEIVWTGAQTDFRELADKAGIDKVITWADIDAETSHDLLYLPTYRAQHNVRLKSIHIDELSPSSELRDAIIGMRQYKDETEIEHMEEAAKLSGQMHRCIISSARAGQYEYELVASSYQFAISRQLAMAYSPIMTTKGHILHNHHYNNELREGDLLLNDSGVETASGYCGDISRTFPVSGHFSPIQKDVYNAVLEGYNTAVKMATPGNTFWDVHFGSATTMVEALIDIGWMKGNAEDAVKHNAHSLFFPHGLGHMIGMDVHDMENFGEEYVGYASPHIKATDFGVKYLRLAKELEPGYCLTIEPGIYVNPHLIARMKKESQIHEYIHFERLDQNSSFGGIRIEDNFLITQSGNRNLDGSLPVEATAIEELRAQAIEESLSPQV